MRHKFLVRYLILLVILILIAAAAYGVQELLDEPVQDAVLVLYQMGDDSCFYKW